jgi:putrescine transport system substrate-binding protein
MPRPGTDSARRVLTFPEPEGDEAVGGIVGRHADLDPIPGDHPNPEAAHAFIEYLLDPKVIAAVSNYVYYANPNTASQPYLEEELRSDPAIYPPPEVRARLFVNAERSDKELRSLNRLWTRLKANR